MANSGRRAEPRRGVHGPLCARSEQAASDEGDDERRVSDRGVNEQGASAEDADERRAHEQRLKITHERFAVARVNPGGTLTGRCGSWGSST